MSAPGTAGAPPGALHLEVRRAMLEAPEREAIRTHERLLTVGELAARAGALAERLADGGTAPFLLAPVDAIELAIGLVAASASGRAALIADPRRSPAALVALAGTAGATAAVIGAGTPLGLPSVDPAALGHGTLPSDAPDPDTVLLLAGTSGSTAAPKLVGHTHRSVADRAARRGGSGDVLPDDRVGRTFNHTGATTQSIVASLLLAVPVLALDLLRVAPSTALRRFHDARSTHVRLVPSVLRRLLTATPPDVRLPHVRLIGGGGDPMHWDDVARLRPLLSPHATIIHSYGSTEVHGIARRYLTMDEPLGEGVVPVGRPGPGRHVWIDGGDGRPAGPGVIGEIVVEGRFHAVGPAFEDLGDGIKRHRTRDLGELTHDGELVHRGRVDRMVKIGGVRIEPEAVEAVLRTLPGVLDVAVVPEGDDPDRMRLVAHVVALPAAAPDPDALRAAVAAQVTSAAVPATFHLRTEPLPLLASGKVDRRALRSREQGSLAEFEQPTKSPARSCPVGPRSIAATDRAAGSHEKDQRMRRTGIVYAMAAVLVLASLAGCTSATEPAAAPAAPEDDPAPATAAEALAAVAALDLPEDERIALLAERAVAEGGTLTVYATGQPTVNEAWAQAFMDEFPGITVGIVNLEEDGLVQRLVAEAAAGRSLADVIRSTRPGMVAVQNSELLVEHRGVIVPDDHAGRYASPHDVVITTAPFVIPRLTTDAVDGGPEEWDDFLDPEHAGCVFAGSPTWTATLVAERGEEGAAAWFEGFLANGGQMAEGSTSVLRKLGSGEVECSVMAQASSIERVILEDGIPLDWTQPSWTAATTHGIAVHRDTARPHAAALFALWVAGPGGGQIAADQGELPVSPRVTLRSERLAPWLDPSSPESAATIVLDLEETGEYESVAFGLLERYFTPNLVAE